LFSHNGPCNIPKNTIFLNNKKWHITAKTTGSIPTKFCPTTQQTSKYSLQTAHRRQNLLSTIASLVFTYFVGRHPCSATDNLLGRESDIKRRTAFLHWCSLLHPFTVTSSYETATTAAWISDNIIHLYQQRYSTPGPVSTWMGDPSIPNSNIVEILPRVGAP